MVTGSQPPPLTLYKNASSPSSVETADSGQPINFSITRADNDVSFYCDVSGWLSLIMLVMCGAGDACDIAALVAAGFWFSTRQNTCGDNNT